MWGDWLGKRESASVRWVTKGMVLSEYITYTHVWKYHNETNYGGKTIKRISSYCFAVSSNRNIPSWREDKGFVKFQEVNEIPKAQGTNKIHKSVSGGAKILQVSQGPCLGCYKQSQLLRRDSLICSFTWKPCRELRGAVFLSFLELSLFLNFVFL